MKELLILSGIAVWIYLLIYVSYVLVEKVEAWQKKRKAFKGRQSYERMLKRIEDGVREGCVFTDFYTIVDHNDELLAKGKIKQPDRLIEDMEVNRRNKYTYEYDSVKFRYVEDRLDDYLKGELCRIDFAKIFGSSMTHEEKKKAWTFHIEKLRNKYGKDFDEI